MSLFKMPLEPELKSNIINHLIDEWGIGTHDLIINEFTVGDLSRRVDLALIKSNRLFAFEVKSDADSLVRLQGQVDKYLTYFDKVIVVTAPKHTRKALEITPLHVAIWEISNGKISIKRKGRIKAVNSKKELIEMMTAVELRKLARQLDIKTLNIRRKTLETALMLAPCYKLRDSAINFIKNRYKSRNDKFFEKICEGNSTPDDLEYLKLSRRNVKTAEVINIECFISALEELKSAHEKNHKVTNMVVNV
ncbi:sce7726 family protein [Shewanella scandinavica]|uniref:Sce7726 family protein n=1 Tax=Shewanella scandinavica TaxID=3063538 RepID=A0ABU3G5R3_9GAMM|nr:sce7726 family protein [Shewanella sp. SP2S1-2]MDT3282983.1 sce7726 family protein [Shewanella sp. SP2S1-2]